MNGLGANLRIEYTAVLAVSKTAVSDCDDSLDDAMFRVGEGFCGDGAA